MSADSYPDCNTAKWFLQVHASALLALTIIGAILLYPQFKSVRRSEIGGGYDSREFGWPLVHRAISVHSPGEDMYLKTWDSVALWVNATTVTVLVGGATIGAARLAHQCRWPPRYSLASLFELTLIVAGVFSAALPYQQMKQMLKISEPWLLPAAALVACGLTLLSVKPMVQLALRLVKRPCPVE